MRMGEDAIVYSNLPPPLDQQAETMEVVGHQDECSNRQVGYHDDDYDQQQRRSFWSEDVKTKFLGGMPLCECTNNIKTDCESTEVQKAAASCKSNRMRIGETMPTPTKQRVCVSTVAFSTPFQYALLTFLLVVTSLSCLVITPVHSFNIDVPSVVTHRGPSSSMFGFSVAMHRDSNISWILVGAPTAESVMQPGLRKAGAVYRCSSTQSDSCQQLPFDRQGNNFVEGVQRDDKSNQWFGATVRSSGEDGIILACAPRYVWFSTNKKRRDPVGTCFVAKDSFTEFVEYSPCRTKNWGYHRQGSCQLGLGADIDSDGRRLFMGAVGSWYWQGQLYMIDSRKSTREGPVPFYQFIPSGQVYSQAVGSRPDIRWTREGPSWDDDSYLGYSVAHGEFTGDRESDVAVGMPRGSNLTGKVVLYSSELINIQNITGDQIGAYFGYALAVLDIDGDGLDDLVIGAPMYTDFDDPAMKIETGRVYVLYQSGQHHFVKFEGLDGTAHKGRFGLALASCGDLNKDGFNDFAVGAPYDGLYGRGAVYIYHGSATGVRKESTQVIFGEELPYTVSTFGFSLSGGKDLDGNQYPDLIVGAYESDAVAYFRSKPVVRVKSKVSFPYASNKQINLDEKACTLRDRTAVTCTQLAICMEYDGVGADDVIDFNVQYTLDAKKPKEPRMFFLNHEGRNVLNETVRLTKRKEVCNSQQVYLRPQIRDKLTSLEAELRSSMRESRYYERRELPPVIDVTTSSVEKESISIQKNCGSDNICVPNLVVKVNQSDRSFLMGSTKRIWVEVEVTNTGEDSYETMLFMRVPEGLSYVNFDRLDTSKDVPILCSAPTPSTNNTLRCDIGNPLPFHSKARLRVFFQPRYGSEIKSSYDFHIEANSTNPEDIHKRGDNLMRVGFPIRVQTDMKVFGVSDPQPVRHNASQWKRFKEKNLETEVGPEVTHIYEVKCEGPSDIQEAEVTILWPSYTVTGEHLVYLLEQPMVDGPAICDHVDDVNPLALTLSRKAKWQSQRTQQQYYEEQGVVTAGGIDYDTEEGILRRTDGGYVRVSQSGRGGGSSSGGGSSHGKTSYSSSSSSKQTTSYSSRGQQGGGSSYSAAGHGGGSYSSSASIGESSTHSSIGSSSRESGLYGGAGSSRGVSSVGGGSITHAGGVGGGSSSITHGGGSTYSRTTTTTHHAGTGSAVGGGASTRIDSEEGILRREQAGVTSVGTGTGSQPNRNVFGSPVSGVLVHGAFDVTGANTGDNVESRHTSAASGQGRTRVTEGSTSHTYQGGDNVYTAGGVYGGGGSSRRQQQQHHYGGGSSSAAGTGDVVGSGLYRESEEYVSTTYTRGGAGSERQSGFISGGSASDVRSAHGSSGGGIYGGGFGAGGAGYLQNTSSQHEYRREHSLGGGSGGIAGGSSGGYAKAYNYSRSYSSHSQSETAGRHGSLGGNGVGDEYEESYWSSRNRRSKRAIPEDLEKEMSCGPTKCVRIRCHIKHFPRNSSVIFMLRGRIFSDTIQEFHGDGVNVSSKLVTWVTQLPYNVDPTYLKYRKYEIDTTIEELPDLSVPAPIPWWVYFLAALAGVLLLLLIVYIFYKCGFFKRRRRPSGPEAQPLNRY